METGSLYPSAPEHRIGGNDLVCLVEGEAHASEWAEGAPSVVHFAMLGIDGIIYSGFPYTPADRRLDHRFDAAFAAMADPDRALFGFAGDLYRERFASTIEPAALNRRAPNRPYLCVRVRADSSDVDVSQVTFT